MNASADNKETSADEVIHQPHPRYGDPLRNARKRMSLSIEDVYSEINITPDIIAKIENSAIGDIPPATFMLGYIRAYAKMLEVPVEPILADFSRAVPSGTDRELRARSSLPRETDRHSPVIKIISVLLIAGAIFAVLYGIYTYYSEKMQDYEADSEQNALDLPPRGVSLEGIVVQQEASVTGDDEPVVDDIAPDLLELEEQVPEADQEAVLQAVAEPAPVPASEPVETEAQLKLYADEDSWVEITDAGGKRLFYNLLKQGAELETSGRAPFSVFLGNAPSVTVSLDGLDVIVNSYIRGNKTAQFRVSSEDGRVVFHKR